METWRNPSYMSNHLWVYVPPWLTHCWLEFAYILIQRGWKGINLYIVYGILVIKFIDRFLDFWAFMSDEIHPLNFRFYWKLILDRQASFSHHITYSLLLLLLRSFSPTPLFCFGLFLSLSSIMFIGVVISSVRHKTRRIRQKSWTHAQRSANLAHKQLRYERDLQ